VTGRRRYTLAVAVGAIALAAAVASCGPPSPEPVLPSPSGSPRDGGTYRFPLKADPLGIEPLTAQDAGGMQVAHQVFQGLVAYELNEDGVLQTVPALAIKWTANSTAKYDAGIISKTLRGARMWTTPDQRVSGRAPDCQTRVRRFRRVRRHRRVTALSDYESARGISFV